MRRLRADQMDAPFSASFFFCYLLYLGLRGINLVSDNTASFHSSVFQSARIFGGMIHICDWDIDFNVEFPIFSFQN